jgi:hypothetical protein
MQSSDTSSSPLWDQLQQILNPDNCSEFRYKSYFHKDFWTVEEYGALMVGLTPDRFAEIRAEKGSTPTSKEFQRCTKAHDLMMQLIKDLMKKENAPHVRLTDGTALMSCWRYIKWTAKNKAPVLGKFFKALPLTWMELFIEFQSPDEALRTKSRFSKEYHRAQYLKHAQELLNSSPNRMTRKEIYSDSRMQSVMDSFQDHNGKRKEYKRRTITDSWLREIDKQSRGRPKTKEKGR